MLTKAKTTGAGKVVRFKRRQKRRNPRRPLESVAQDFERWDAAAKTMGVNWSEFARRSMNHAAWLIEKPGARIGFVELVSEKGGDETEPPARKKVAGTRGGRKG